jgi:hypothetical protein
MTYSPLAPLKRNRETGMRNVPVNIRQNLPWVKSIVLTEDTEQMQFLRDVLEFQNCDGTITLEHDMWGSPNIIIRAYIREMPKASELDWMQLQGKMEGEIYRDAITEFPPPVYFVGVIVERPTSMIARELGPSIKKMQARLAAKPRLWEGI